MKVAILGGTRFIGFHLASALSDGNAHQVTLFNRGRTLSPEPLPSSVNIVIGDRNVPAHISHLLDQSFDVVFDFSGKSPHHVMPFLTTSNRSRIGHYVFCSTSSVYLIPPPCPHTEAAPRTTAKGTYGGDKAAIENLLIGHWHRDRWPVTIIRPQAVFGPCDAAQAAFVFSRLINSLPIYLHDGAKHRINFLYVHDLVSALIGVIGTTTSHGRSYNIAGSDTIDPQDFITICSKICNYPVDLRVTTDWRHRYAQIGIPWLPYDLVADNQAIVRDIGLTFTPLKTALTHTWTWLQAHPEQLAPQFLPAEHYLSRNRRVPLNIVATGMWKILTSSPLVRLLRRPS